MDEKEKLIEVILDCIDKTDYCCEICQKAGFKCPVVIPEDIEITGEIPNFDDCNFKEQVYKTLTIEH